MHIMRRIFRFGLMLCTFGFLIGCSDEGDYAELIVGKWLTEYGYIEKLDDQGICIGTERIEPQGDRFVTEFLSDGNVNSYMYGEEPVSDNQNRTYRVEGKHLIFVASNGYESIMDINVLNRKTLDISCRVDVADEYDGPEIIQVSPGISHTVFKRL